MKHIHESIIGRKNIISDFRKKDFQYGDVIVDRAGKVYIFDLTKFRTKTGWSGLGFYRDDLTSYSDTLLDIMKVYRIQIDETYKIDDDLLDKVKEIIPNIPPIWARKR